MKMGITQVHMAHMCIPVIIMVTDAFMIVLLQKNFLYDCHDYNTIRGICQ